MGNKKEVKFVCTKCGKERPIDTKQSTENWTVYDMQAVCKCGNDEFELKSDKQKDKE